MENSLVSIIVPIYNVEKYLKKCVNTLISQTYKNIEIFLVDDGSQDNSGKICDELKKEDSRIKVVHKENGGYGSVLEYAINHISGEYFLICDPDDWIEINTVDDLYETMIKNDVDIVVGRKKLVYMDDHEDSDEKEFATLNEGKYDKLTKFLGIPCSPHAKLYKTELAQNIKFPKRINNTDFLLYIVYLSRVKSAYYLDKELANYFIDRPGNSFNEDTTITEKSIKSNAIVTKETYNQVNKESNMYTDIIMSLFIRSCRYLALFKKVDIDNDEYKGIFNNIIDKSYKYRKYLKKYIKTTTLSKSKALLKISMYKMFWNENMRKLAILMLSKKIK